MARKATRELKLIEVEYVAHRVAQELMEYNEPIPSFNTRYPDILESCLKTPFQKFNRKSLYPTIEKKAATLFYLMIKNHPFQNGNKRVAVITLLYFLNINRRWINVPQYDLYLFAKKVAKSRAIKHKKVKKEILEFINNHIIIKKV
jgi:death on curing protein